jgi:hypothetical protein
MGYTASRTFRGTHSGGHDVTDPILNILPPEGSECPIREAKLLSGRAPGGKRFAGRRSPMCTFARRRSEGTLNYLEDNASQNNTPNSDGVLSTILAIQRARLKARAEGRNPTLRELLKEADVQLKKDEGPIESRAPKPDEIALEKVAGQSHLHLLE